MKILVVTVAVVVAACGGGEVITEPTDGDTPVTSPDTTAPDPAPDTTIAPDPGSTEPPTTDPTFEGEPPVDSLPPVGWIEGPFFVEGSGLLIMESYPIQVRLDVSGSVPTPCNEPFWRIIDDGSTLSVELFTATDPDLACTQVIAEKEVQIPLGSWAGESRTVLLDGEEAGAFES
jgi:hypothetical protein